MQQDNTGRMQIAYGTQWVVLCFDAKKKAEATRPGSRLRYLLAGQSSTVSILRRTFPVAIPDVILGLPEGKKKNLSKRISEKNDLTRGEKQAV